MKIVLGILFGLVLAGGFGFTLGYLVFELDTAEAIIMAACFAAVGIAYSSVAFGYTVYEAGFGSIVGYILDMTWSIINTLSGMLVWIPACLIAGANFLPRDAYSRRSGTFVYDKNPRGAGYSATTIGTVIAGQWSAHEETHVWQARIYGPAYLICWGLSFGLNILFRLLTFRTSDLIGQAYHRVPFEDWAYWGGDHPGPGLHPLGWIGGLLLGSLYVTLVVLIVIGIVEDETSVWVIGTVGLAMYHLIRALLPAGH
jgi:hypothetical protein